MSKLILFTFILICFCVPLKAQQVTLAVHQPDPISISSPFTELSILQGEKIVLGKDLLISGGLGNYRKIWSSTGWDSDSVQPVITVVPVDTAVYTLKVIDENNCSAEQSYQVNVVTLLQIEDKISPVSCFGKNDGMATLTITGGAPPYLIEWSNGATTNVLENLAPSDYTATVTDQMNQKQEKTITITEPAQISKELNISICQGSSYKFGDKDLKEAGTYESTFKTIGNCDSIVTLHLNVHPIFTQTITAEICQGDTYPFGGIERLESGQYENILKSKSGCDSIVILNLKVNPVFTKTLEAQLCQGESYPFGGIERFESGQYENKLKSISGCDSIVILNLKVNPVFTKTLDVHLCQGESYHFAGNDLTSSGQYQNTLKTNQGCDSTYMLNLSVHPLPEIPVITQRGDTLVSSSINGNQWLKDGVEMEGENKPTLVITHSGNYSVTVTNDYGCSISSANCQAIKTDVPIVYTTDFTCNVFPNPNSGLFIVEIQSDLTDQLVLELLTTDGKLVKKQKLEHRQGKQTIQFGKARLAEGIYNLHIRFGKQTVSRKLVVHQ